MNSYQYIDQQVHELANQEISECFSPGKVGEVLERLASMHLDPEEMDFDDLHELIQADEDISTLPRLNKLVQLLREEDDLNITLKGFSDLSALLELYPKTGVYRLLWIRFKVGLLESEEHYFKQVTDFLEMVFREHGDLINNIDNFLSATEINMLLWGALWKPETHELLLPVMERAVEKYPGKIYLKYILGRLYASMDKHKHGLDQLNAVREYCNDRWSGFDNDEFDSFDFLDYLDIIQELALIHDKLGEDEEVAKDVDYILKNLPTLYGPDDLDGIEDVQTYLDAFFLRMRLDMKNGNRSKVLSNYEKVKHCLEWEEHKPFYKEVIAYVKKQNQGE